MLRPTMETDAWKALSTTAQALYPWLKLEWKGSKANNNGKVKLSVRQAAKRMGVGHDAANRAFHDLQAKGFIVVTETACLGVGGEAKGFSYEITELAMPSGAPSGRKLYQQWRKGHDHPVVTANTNNPNGNNGRTRVFGRLLSISGPLKQGSV